MQYSTTQGRWYPPVNTVVVRGHKDALAALLRWALLAQALHLTAVIHLQAMTTALPNVGRQYAGVGNGGTASLHSSPRQLFMHQQLSQMGICNTMPA